MKVKKYLRKTWAPVAYRLLDLVLPASRVSPGGIALPDMKTKLAVGDNVPLLVFAAADAHYFDRYGHAFIGSLIDNAPQAAIHIHLFNPRQEQLDQLETFATSLLPALSFSWETVDLDHLDTEHRGRYYYSMRFVRLAEVLKKVPVPCLCLDIDALLVRSIGEILAAVKDSDLAFYARFDKFGANTKLLAGTLYTKPVPEVSTLLENIAAQIRRFIQQGRLMEKLDQLVIYDYFSRLRKRSTAFRFKALDQRVIDLRFTPEGIVWYPKGDSKHHARYAARVRQYEAVYDSIADAEWQQPINCLHL